MIKTIDWDSWPFEKGSYEYYFDIYFDIPEGIPEEEYTDLYAHKFALRMIIGRSRKK
tara:strand:+ start:93 stop:263 length:171 start_codon:yes stop_codon:yes gene_type:complete